MLVESRVTTGTSSHVDMALCDEVILEWTFAFGGITVILAYCVSEIVQQKLQQQQSMKTVSPQPREVAAFRIV